jgi:deazaflavin-dependent oxidoreductase (nitroreductase family)
MLVAMLTVIAIVLALLVLVVVALGVVFVVGMRTKSPLVLDAIRGVARRLVNPRQLKSAGTPGAYASVIRHRGRKTGAPYETPVQAVRTGDGFVIPLPYGSRSSWLKNLLAGGSATLVNEGEAFRVDRPEVVPIDSVADHFSSGDQRSLRFFGVDRCLRVRRQELE